MNSLASGASSEYSIRDVIYAEHYARRIARLFMIKFFIFRRTLRISCYQPTRKAVPSIM